MLGTFEERFLLGKREKERRGRKVRRTKLSLEGYTDRCTYLMSLLQLDSTSPLYISASASTQNVGIFRLSLCHGVQLGQRPTVVRLLDDTMGTPVGLHYEWKTILVLFTLVLGTPLSLRYCTA